MDREWKESPVSDEDEEEVCGFTVTLRDKKERERGWWEITCLVVSLLGQI